jgi:hypothetical protein
VKKQQINSLTNNHLIYNLMVKSMIGLYLSMYVLYKAINSLMNNHPIYNLMVKSMIVSYLSMYVLYKAL